MLPNTATEPVPVANTTDRNSAASVVIAPLPGYGAWLKKEIDIYLRVQMGM